MEPANHNGRFVTNRDAIIAILAISLLTVTSVHASSFFTITNTSWRMFKGTNEASLPDTTAWRLRNFDDTSWTLALAPVFYSTALTEPPFYDGISTNNTVLTDMQNRYSTVFFRKTFVVSNAATIALLNLDAVCDDGLVVWLNGAEILRVNVPAGELPYNSLALISRTEPLPIVTYTISNAPGLLLEGTNVVAVQGLNRSLDSSDFGFMAGLASAIDDVAPTVTDLTPPAGSSVQSLTQIMVQFSETVTNVDPADLLINGGGAIGLSNLAPNRFLFTFAQPQTGTVSVIWSSTNQITNLASNSFTGGSWSYQLNTNVFAGAAEITEFMADNSKTLLDEDGDSSDWIEIHNPGPTPVALDGWFLTDKNSNLRKWRFPATNLIVNGYLVVFASGKDRSVPGAPLHTNFKLASAGGYLALVRPDGISVATEFNYGQQHTDISFGISRLLDAAPLVATGSLARVLVPSDDFLGLEWTGGSEPFDDSGWLSATNALGFDQSSGGAGLTPIGFWDFDNATIPTIALEQKGHNHHGTLQSPAFTASRRRRHRLCGQ